MTETNLLQELEQDWQKQRLEELWRRYGRIVIAAAVGVVLATALSSWWTNHVAQNRQQATAALLAVINEQGTDAAAKSGKLADYIAKTNEAGLKSLARLQAAASAPDAAARTAAYDALAQDQDVEPQFRELATLLGIKSQIDHADAKTLQDRLQPLLDKSIWRYTARELAGHLALKMGDRAKAREHFTYLTQDASTPQRISERAQDMARYVAE
jgi:hypothetical protein